MFELFTLYNLFHIIITILLAITIAMLFIYLYKRKVYYKTAFLIIISILTTLFICMQLLRLDIRQNQIYSSAIENMILEISNDKYQYKDFSINYMTNDQRKIKYRIFDCINELEQIDIEYLILNFNNININEKIKNKSIGEPVKVLGIVKSISDSNESYYDNANKIVVVQSINGTAIVDIPNIDIKAGDKINVFGITGGVCDNKLYIVGIARK